VNMPNPSVRLSFILTSVIETLLLGCTIHMLIAAQILLTSAEVTITVLVAVIVVQHVGAGRLDDNRETEVTEVVVQCDVNISSLNEYKAL
jgi:uncharacterized membrane protein